MKKSAKFIALTIVLNLGICISAIGQYNDFLKEFYFYRQPSARSEAMGRGYVSMLGDLSSTFYNPAGISGIEGLTFYTSISTPLYALPLAKYYFVSAGYKVNQYFKFAFTYHKLDFGEAIPVTDIFGNDLGSFRPVITNYTLSLASEPFKNLHLGGNINYLADDALFIAKTKNVTFDLGAIEKIQIGKNEKSKHELSVGVSIKNINYPKAIFPDYGGYIDTLIFPVISRFGANYKFSAFKQVLKPDLTTYELTIQVEKQILFNSKYYQPLSFGAEFRYLELFAFRIGYYYERLNIYNAPLYNFTHLSEITYGFGINIPLEKITDGKTPLIIKLDFGSLIQPKFGSSTIPGRFVSFNIHFIFQLK